MKNILKTQTFMKDISELLGGKPTLQKVQVLTYIYLNEPCSTSDIQKFIGSTMGGASKIVHDMTSLTSRKKVGVGILDVRQDTMNLKSNIITVSSLGRTRLDPLFNNLNG